MASCESFRALFVSDFFYPKVGGIENHQYQLAQALITQGHKVVILTGTYGDDDERQGVRYMTKGLKVYYCPSISLYDNSSLPLGCFFPYFRSIVIREKINIVHAHQTSSGLAFECLIHAATMGIKSVYTDHSLFGFNNATAIHLNKAMKFALACVDQVICVSHCSKENLVVRCNIDPHIISVIPNAVDSSKFTQMTSIPSTVPRSRQEITIVIMSRLVYRKGADLLNEVIPEICRRFPRVRFIVGGDGPKRTLIEQMRETYQLQDRVVMLGEVSHSQVRDVLCKGQLFLNCSLTDSFCIAILEAASCGLFVVSTKVGGVPEVLPPDMIRFTEPTSADIVEVLTDAIPHVHQMDATRFHDRVAHMYNWFSAAARTQIVYEKVMTTHRLSLIGRFRQYSKLGTWFGKVCCGLAVMDFFLLRFLEYIYPSSEIDEAVDFPYDELHSM